MPRSRPDRIGPARWPACVTPAEFIAKWQASTRNERAACQEHFIDLCRLLDEPTPNFDPTGEDYAFEKGATKFTGEDGWSDVWRRNCFAWEYKTQWACSRQRRPCPENDPVG